MSIIAFFEPDVTYHPAATSHLPEHVRFRCFAVEPVPDKDYSVAFGFTFDVDWNPAFLAPPQWGWGWQEDSS